MASVEQTGASTEGGKAGPVISLEDAKAKPAAEIFDIERKLDLDEDAHRAELKARLGLTPEDIVTRVVIFSSLQAFALAFMGVVLTEYFYYYVVNDPVRLAWVLATRLAVGSLISLFFVPFCGRLSDRCGRRPLIIFGSVLVTLSLCMYAFAPGLESAYVSAILSAFGTVAGSAMDGMIRDTFSSSLFNHKEGGMTGVQSRVYGYVIVAGLVGLISALIPLFVFKNEYTEKCKCVLYTTTNCTTHYDLQNRLCIQPYSVGPFEFPGGLKLNMLLSLFAFFVALIYAIIFFPETLRPTHQKMTVSEFLSDSWAQVLNPLDNVRPMLATPLLRVALIAQSARFFQQSIYSQVLVQYLIWRYGFTSSEWGLLVLLTALCSLPWVCAIPALVAWIGDYKMWILSIVALIPSLAICAFLPSDPNAENGMTKTIWYLNNAILAPPALMIVFVSTALFGKLVPTDIQATVQTGRDAVDLLAKLVSAPIAAGLWQWLVDQQAADGTSTAPEGIKGIHSIIGLLLAVVMLGVLTINLGLDPKEKIDNDTILDDFFESEYAQSEGYKQVDAQSSA